MKILVATTNPGKQREIATLLEHPQIKVLFPQDLAAVSALKVEETGTTFQENALLKAEAYAAGTNLLTVADDSGLEVTALDGFPGVHSARWHPGSDQERVQALLEKLKNEQNREAKFVTVACLFDPKTKESQYFKGEIIGTLSETARGTAGFAYDFIFIPKGHTQTFSELGVAAKNDFSHRAAAFLKVREFLVSRI